MKPICYYGILLFALFICVAGTSTAQSPDWLWAKSMDVLITIGRNGMAVDPGSRDVYTTGSFSGTVDFDPGVGIFKITPSGINDLFISKLDGSGNFVWVKSMGGTGSTSGSALVVDPGSGDVYATGTFSGTVDFNPGSDTFNITSAGSSNTFISKFDSSGNFVWAKAIVGTGLTFVNAITLDTAGIGCVYITGSFKGTADFDPGADMHSLTSTPITGGEVLSDMFILKLDGLGNFVWAEVMAGSGTPIGLSIAVDPGSGDVCTTGSIMGGEIDFDPGTDTFYLGSSLPPCGLHPACFTMFISKLDGSGNFIWAKEIDERGQSKGVEIAFDPAGSGDVYTIGHFNGTSDFDPGSDTFNLTSAGDADICISKLDRTGNFVWAKAMGASGWDQGRSIAIDPSSREVCVMGRFEGTVDFDPGDGTFNLTSAGGSDMFISKLDNSGHFIWAKAIGGVNDDFGSVMTLDAAGYVTVAGSFYSPSISFGSITLINADTFGPPNIFIAKLDTAFTTSVVNVYAKKHPINIYPNPAKDELTIAFDDDGSLNVGITMFTIPGEVVFSTRDQNLFHAKTIDISHLATGIYFVEINIDGDRVMKKVVKE